MALRRLTRRGTLTLGVGLLVAAPALAAPRDTLHLGVVLPERQGRALLPADDWGIAAEAARQGAVMGGEEYGFNASLFGTDVILHFASAPDAEAAGRAAHRLAALDGVAGLIGGFGEEAARAISEAAGQNGIPFLNIGATADALRGADCGGFTFHVEASDAMYLDALAAWFVRAGFRRWYILREDTSRGEALHARALRALQDRHWGASVAGAAAVDPERPEFGPALTEIAGNEPDLVLLLLPWIGQLDFLEQYERRDLPAAVTGLPDPVAQTREFFATGRERAPRAGTWRRAVLWEATLDAYGARELNERFQTRWGRPMEGSAWAAYQAVKILFEAFQAAGAADGAAMAAALADQRAVFDVHKGIGVSFRPWDRQLRQSLYLVHVDAEAELARNLARIEGEMPAIYMPETDAVERLDQLGDRRPAGSCTP